MEPAAASPGLQARPRALRMLSAALLLQSPSKKRKQAPSAAAEEQPDAAPVAAVAPAPAEKNAKKALPPVPKCPTCQEDMQAPTPTGCANGHKTCLACWIRNIVSSYLLRGMFTVRRGVLCLVDDFKKKRPHCNNKICTFGPCVCTRPACVVCKGEILGPVLTQRHFMTGDEVSVCFVLPCAQLSCSSTPG